jgi:hypothetical protein
VSGTQIGAETAGGMTDWSDTLASYLALMAAFDGPEIAEEVMARDTFEDLCRKADRRANTKRKPDDRLDRPRNLLDDDDSLIERVWAELNAPRGRAPEATVEALMYSLRRGVEELTKPDALRRLSELSQEQMLEVCGRLQTFKPNIATAWAPEEVDALAQLWSTIAHEHQ